MESPPKDRSPSFGDHPHLPEGAQLANGHFETLVKQYTHALATQYFLEGKLSPERYMSTDYSGTFPMTPGQPGPQDPDAVISRSEGDTAKAKKIAGEARHELDQYLRTHSSPSAMAGYKLVHIERDIHRTLGIEREGDRSGPPGDTAPLHGFR